MDKGPETHLGSSFQHSFELFGLDGLGVFIFINVSCPAPGQKENKLRKMKTRTTQSSEGLLLDFDGIRLMFSFNGGREGFDALAFVLSTSMYPGIARSTTTSCEEGTFQSERNQGRRKD